MAAVNRGGKLNASAHAPTSPGKSLPLMMLGYVTASPATGGIVSSADRKRWDENSRLTMKAGVKIALWGRKVLETSTEAGTWTRSTCQMSQCLTFCASLFFKGDVSARLTTEIGARRRRRRRAGGDKQPAHRTSAYN